MSLLILGRGEAGRAYRLRTICGVNRIAVDSARIDTRIYTQRGEGGEGTRVEQLIGNVSKMNASMDPGVSGDLNRTG